MNLVREHRNYLEFLASSRPKSFKQALLDAPPGVVKALVEIAYNLLEGNVRLTQDNKKKLRPFEEDLLKLIRPGKISRKRATLANSGYRYIPAILKLVLTQQ